MIAPEELKKDVLMLAKEVGVSPREIHIRTMKRKWASCSSRGRLTFDKSLLNEPEEVRFKVILHELLHLKYPNHGKMFNSLLDTYLEASINSNNGGETEPPVAEQK
jgi:hypothetical protein